MVTVGGIGLATVSAIGIVTGTGRTETAIKEETATVIGATAGGTVTATEDETADATGARTAS